MHYIALFLLARFVAELSTSGKIEDNISLMNTTMTHHVVDMTEIIVLVVTTDRTILVVMITTVIVVVTIITMTMEDLVTVPHPTVAKNAPDPEIVRPPPTTVAAENKVVTDPILKIAVDPHVTIDAHQLQSEPTTPPSVTTIDIVPNTDPWRSCQLLSTLAATILLTTRQQLMQYCAKNLIQLFI